MKHPYNRTGLTSRLRHLALAAVLTGGVGTAHAQFYAATGVTNVTGTYTDLGTTGTAIATANTDDASSTAQTIGFTFTYNGTSYTQFVLNTNGYLKLGATAPVAPFFNDGGLSTTGGPTAGADTDLIMPFNGDLVAGSAGTEYRVVTTGTAPNRVCTIQWKNVSDKARVLTSTSAAIDVQYANISFQTKLYETSNQIEFVYGTALGATAGVENPKIFNVGVKGSGTGAAQLVLGVKASATAWSQSVFLGGLYTGNGHNIRRSVLPDPGRTYRFTVQVPNDAYAAAIQGYGSVAVPVGNPITIRGVVGNAGTTALTGTVVTLAITGANTVTQTQTIASMPVGGTTSLATFSGISLPNAGTNTVTLSVPSDGNNGNNSVSQTMETSATTFSYITPGIPQASSYGFTAGTTAFTSAFCGKFTVSAARAVTAVRAVIGNDPNLAPNTVNGQRSTTVFGVVINATTGAILGRSPDYVLTAADLGQLHTFTLPAPITVPSGDFLVGLAQVVGAGSYQVFPMAYQPETPARVGLFYSSGVSTPGTPNESSVNNARYMLEAVTAAPSNNDVAVNEIQGYGSVAVPVGNPITLRAVVRNAGAAVLSNVVVTLNITGANTVTQTQTLTSVAVGATAQVSFAGLSLPNAGANTVTVSVPNDDNNTNNSVADALTTSATTFSFIKQGVGAANAFGVPVTTAARTIAFCGKFTVNAPRDVTAVRAFIYPDPNLIPNTTNGQRTTTVYGVVVNATTGAVIARSADYVLTSADLGQLHSFNLSATVPAGDFLVGLAQVTPAGATTDGVFPMAVQDETPARTGLFYTVNITTAAATAPVDAAANDSRYMLEAVTSAPSTCPTPTGLALTGVTATTASFSFVAPVGSPTGYQIVYGPSNFTPGTASSASAPFTGTTYTLTGLTPSTAYDFYVKAICSATDQSGYGGPVRATTACTPPTISTYPYTQNFDVISAGQTLPCGITVTDVNADGFTWAPRGAVSTIPGATAIARSAPNAMVYVYNSADATVGGNDWFFTPALTMTATQRYRLSFYYRVASGFAERMEVKYGTAATPAGQTTTLFTNNAITTATYVLASNATTPAVIDITPAAGNYYVGFHATSAGDQGFLAVDDISISAGPLATSEALKRAVSVFPNPSNTGVFNLEIHGANAKQALAVEVTNMLGQVVYKGTAKDNFRTDVNLSSLASGIYSIKVLNGQEYTMQQISIVK